MEYEASHFGLKFERSDVKQWLMGANNELQSIDSLSILWKILEYLPIKRQTYKEGDVHTR